MKTKLLYLLLFFYASANAQVELISSGISNAYTLFFPGNTTAYWNGWTITFKAHLANTGPATINVNGHGAKAIINTAGNGLFANDIIAGQIVTITYDGAKFQMTSAPGNLGTSTSINGAGTAGYVAKWTTATQLGSSVLQDDGINIGVGTAPSYKLHVNGRIKSDGINETSDARLKKNIATIDSALEKLTQLRGVTFNWKANENKDRYFETTEQIGVIAQEIELVFPQLVYTDKQGFKSVDYSKLSAILIEALKDLFAKMQNMKTEHQQSIEALEQKNTQLTTSQTAEIAELKTQLKDVQSSIQLLLKLNEQSKAEKSFHTD